MERKISIYRNLFAEKEQEMLRAERKKAVKITATIFIAVYAIISLIILL